QALAERGLSTEGLIVCPGRRTQAKRRVLAASQLLLRLDQGSTEPIAGRTEQALIDCLRDIFAACDAIIVSDYGYGILTPRVRRTLAELQARRPRVVVADSRRLDCFRDAGLTAVKPNFDEVARLLGGQALGNARGRADAVAAHGERLLEATGAQIVAATLDREGA